MGPPSNPFSCPLTQVPSVPTEPRGAYSQRPAVAPGAGWGLIWSRLLVRAGRAERYVAETGQTSRLLCQLLPFYLLCQPSDGR